jgi:hypothetical protein
LTIKDRKVSRFVSAGVAWTSVVISASIIERAMWPPVGFVEKPNVTASGGMVNLAEVMASL